MATNKEKLLEKYPQVAEADIERALKAADESVGMSSDGIIKDYQLKVLNLADYIIARDHREADNG